MGIYGHRFDALIENNNLDTKDQYLVEFKISKEDLEDPKALKRIIDKSQKEYVNDFKNATKLGVILATVSDIILGVATGSIIIPLVTYIPFIIGAFNLTAKLLINKYGPDNGPGQYYKFEYKNVNMLADKIKEIEKNTKKLEDSKEKQEILKRCTKINKDIEKYKKEF